MGIKGKIKNIKKTSSLRVCALIISAAMLLSVCGCSAQEKKEPGDYDIGYDMEGFIDEFNDYLYEIIINSEEAETTQMLYDSVKLSKERFVTDNDASIPYDYVEYSDSTSLLASMYCFRNAETGKYNQIVVWAPYSSYTGSLYSYFIFIVTSAAASCVTAGVDKNDSAMITKTNEMVGDICSTVKASGSQSELVHFGKGCFYASFSDVQVEENPRVFFYMAPEENCGNYVEYDAFAAEVEAGNIDDGAEGVPIENG